MKVFVIVLLLGMGVCYAGQVSDESKVAFLGMKAVKELHETMQSNLKKAVKEKGSGGAIDFCSSKAEELLKKVSNKESLNIKRTTFKFRNKKDAPDGIDEYVLKELESTYKKTGKLPKYVVKKVYVDGRGYYLFYRPIVVKKKCLDCHGDVSKMDKRVVEAIRKNYPDDKATGYKEGDFRGAIRVDIPEEKLKG